jgi:hypothetical protein
MKFPERAGAWLPRLVLPALGCAALAAACALYSWAPPLYLRVMTFLMIVPLPTPFIDARQMPAVITCWAQGVDVYLTAPCDPMQRTFAYSPLWLRAGFLAVPWSNRLGLGLDALVLLSTAMLPPPRRAFGLLVLILAGFSSMSVFALERGNMDLVMFLLIISGGWLWVRGPALRAAGYALFTLAGLLKFYPLILFLLFIRERRAGFIALCLAAAALVAGFIWYFQAQLHEMARNLPGFSNFTDAFGARQLPGGIGTALTFLLPCAGIHNKFILDIADSGGFAFDLYATLLAAAAAIAYRLSRRPDVIAAFAALTPPERGYLVIGAALFCGCFLVLQNGSYRGIEFLLLLPGLCAMASLGAGGIFAPTAAAIIFVMWGLTFQQIVAALAGGNAYPMRGGAMIFLYWILHELAWWWIVSVLLALLLRFIAQSPLWPRRSDDRLVTSMSKR